MRKPATGMRLFIGLGVLFFVGYVLAPVRSVVLALAYPVFGKVTVPDTLYSLQYAPVKCGPYFLYVHPDFHSAALRGQSRGLRHKLYFVSATPPDLDPRPDTIAQLFAFGVAQHTLSNTQPTTGHAQTHKRSAVRPATFAEVMGQYIDTSYCKPYRPSTQRCNGALPFCDHTMSTYLGRRQ